MDDRIVLRSASGDLQVAIDRASGSLVALDSERLGWRALGAARSARPFELLLPLEQLRRNRTRGARQPTPATEVSAGGDALELRWDRVESEAGGEHDVAISAAYRLDGDALVCTMEIENRSPLVVENVYFPCLSDLQPLPTGTKLDFFTYEYATARRRGLRPHFTNTPGYFGVDRPTIIQSPHAIAVPGSPFLLLDGTGGGLALAVDVPEPELLTFIAELEPGYAESIDSSVPPDAAIGDKEVRVEVAAVHLPYVMPGETRRLLDVRLQFYAGGWHAGAALYRARRRAWMGSSNVPEWAAEPHSWQQVQMNSPEGERRYRFADLPAIASECAERGVRAIQVVGWNDGGQDQNNPSHDPDPLLGGAEELRRAIAECQLLGVKIILFTKFVWSDRATQRFRDELARLAVHDPYGDYYVHPGYRYQTVTQLLDVNTKRLVPMCFASRDWIEVCRREFQKVLDSGADGMLYDECFHHVPALACFDTGHGHRYGQPVYAHDVDFVRWLREQSDRVRADFLYAGEACTDWQLSEYHVSYHRSESTTHVPLMRFLRPDAQLMTAVTGFDDRNMVNQCLLYRYIVSYEPYNFKGRLPDMPLTVAYGRRMDALRRELRRWLWDGEFADTLGAGVTDASNGSAHAPYSVFRSGDGSLAVVVANYGCDERVLGVSVDDWSAASYRLVEEDGWTDASDGVRLPARSAAVVLERPPA
jgi:sugar phosphate isomerase/epimerase